MQFDLTQEFPASLDGLWDALGRADYIERKYRSLGSTSVRMLKFSANARSIEVELERQAAVARDELPLWARVFAGKQQAMRQRTRWTRAGRDRIEVALDISAMGRLIRATGTGSVVEPSSGHSRMTLCFEVGSSIPAFQSSAARLFARQIEHALHADHAFTLDYLRASARRR